MLIIQRGTTQEEKLEIVNELFKYDTPNVVVFLQKIIDAEHNNQIRELVFKHLQDSGHYVKLRKRFKCKKKSYSIETFDYDMKPSDLVARLDKKLLQDKKRYDIFISHSAKDAETVRNIIKHLNDQNKTCYCDWMSDTDFLKRDLVSDYTKEVLKRRIEQSNTVLFVKTENSFIDGRIPSEWIQMEINYSKEIGKKIAIMDCTTDNQKFEISENVEGL